MPFHAKISWTQKRHLNLLEYQSKSLLQESGVAIQEFRVVEGKNDEKNLKDFSKFVVDCLICIPLSSLTYLLNIEVPEYVIKAQILAGGRGKGHFENGFKGGVHITQKYIKFPSKSA